MSKNETQNIETVWQKIFRSILVVLMLAQFFGLGLIGQGLVGYSPVGIAVGLLFLNVGFGVVVSILSKNDRWKVGYAVFAIFIIAGSITSFWVPYSWLDDSSSSQIIYVLKDENNNYSLVRTRDNIYFARLLREYQTGIKPEIGLSRACLYDEGFKIDKKSNEQYALAPWDSLPRIKYFRLINQKAVATICLTYSFDENRFFSEYIADTNFDPRSVFWDQVSQTSNNFPAEGNIEELKSFRGKLLQIDGAYKVRSVNVCIHPNSYSLD